MKKLKKITYVVDLSLLKKLNQWEKEFAVDAYQRYDNIIDYNEAKYNYIWMEWKKYQQKERDYEEMLREMEYKR